MNGWRIFSKSCAEKPTADTIVADDAATKRGGFLDIRQHDHMSALLTVMTTHHIPARFKRQFNRRRILGRSAASAQPGQRDGQDSKKPATRELEHGQQPASPCPLLQFDFKARRDRRDFGRSHPRKNFSPAHSFKKSGLPTGFFRPLPPDLLGSGAARSDVLDICPSAPGGGKSNRRGDDMPSDGACHRWTFKPARPVPLYHLPTPTQQPV